MPDSPKFHNLDRDKFKQVLDRFPFRRKINSVHLHHTWKPNQGQYRGLETIVGMWRFHTAQLGWSDIAQHVSIAPDGDIWTGRDWNRPPASASGFNGNASVGPFMIETIGDFDRGRDRLEGEQLASVLEVIARVQLHAGLPVESLRFHNQMTGQKSCPGTAIGYEEMLERLREVRARLEEGARDVSPMPSPFSRQALDIQEVIDTLDRGAGTRAADPADAELPEDEGGLGRSLAIPSDASRGGDDEITPEMLEELAPYIVNLNQGRFSIAGRMRTSKADVDRIFDEHLPRALEEAQQEDRPLRVILFAHGGLVNEKSGLRIAHKHVSWWRANKVYPLYFVWETGLAEELRQHFGGGQRDLARAPFTDDLIERLIHKPGEKIWSGMKFDAVQAVEPPPPGGAPEDGGGAHYVAQRLAAFCQAHANAVELHAAGHSAGAIFHAHFLPTAFGLGVPPFKSTHFLAPAITNREFLLRLGGHLGPRGVQHLTIFTMKKSFELADNCAKVYRKSLLYLIHFALERERGTPILGLEESLRGDSTLRRVFALDGQPSAVGEVVWSTSDSSTGRNASRSTTHGGFDDDPPTMESVLRRVTGLSDTDRLHREFPRTRALGPESDPWLAPRELPDELAGFFDPLPLPTPVFTPAAPPPSSAVSGGGAVSVAAGAGNGRRRALCIGIDRYPTAPLAGCVADARMWAETLVGLGFERPETLLDSEATRSGILGALERLVESGRSGDVLVFQYAGHGCQLKDVNNDEDDAKDEALCAFDFDAGRFVIDDDLAQVFGRIRDGVNLTCFIDCCHSGTITRVAAGLSGGRPADPTAKARFVVATQEQQEAHAAFRRSLGDTRSVGTRDLSEMREVTFSACQPFEVAFESQGHGEFTVRATRILNVGIQGITHQEFQRRVVEAFGPAGQQRPFLHCAPGVESRALLQVLTGGGVDSGGRGTFFQAGSSQGQQTAVAGVLRSIADLLSQGR